jgi:hypothetical protein
MNKQTKLVGDVTEQETQSLNVASIQSASDFLTYMKTYGLEPLDVALAAGVRYLTVWNLSQGKPITDAHAALVRAGLFQLTGVGYTAPICLLREPAGIADRQQRRNTRQIAITVQEIRETHQWRK